MPFFQKINSGAYRVNPNIIFKWSHSNRMGIYYEYIEKNQEITKEKKKTYKKQSPFL